MLLQIEVCLKFAFEVGSLTQPFGGGGGRGQGQLPLRLHEVSLVSLAKEKGREGQRKGAEGSEIRLWESPQKTPPRDFSGVFPRLSSHLNTPPLTGYSVLTV